MRSKTFPVGSLILLLAAYSTFSWFLYRITAPTTVWVAAVGFALTQALLLTAFSKGFKAFINKWLKSDIGYFSIVALGAFSITVFLLWLHIFEYFLMIGAAEILARLDLQTAGLNQWQALLVLTLIAALGLAVGFSASHIF